MKLKAKTRTKPVGSRSELKGLQNEMAGLLFRPLTPSWRMQKVTDDGRKTKDVVSGFIKPNDRLTSFDRLEIYNRCYWFRILDSLYDDFPGLLAILGNRKFLKLATAYLAQFPSESFTMRNLGSRLIPFLEEDPSWVEPRTDMALDMARFEWAQIIAFDEIALPPISQREIAKKPAHTLRLGLQPYVSLLELDFGVDHFLSAVKKRETDSLRHETSNVSNDEPDQQKRKPKSVGMPKREKVYLAIHRFENMLFHRRLSLAEFVLLSALRRGETLERACAAAVKSSPKSSDKWPEQIKSWFANWSSVHWLTHKNKIHHNL